MDNDALNFDEISEDTDRSSGSDFIDNDLARGSVVALPIPQPTTREHEYIIIGGWESVLHRSHTCKQFSTKPC